MLQSQTLTFPIENYSHLGTEFEEIQLAVSQIRDMLCLFDEEITQELIMLGQYANPVTERFVKKYSKLNNLLCVLDGHIESTIERLQTDIDGSYAVKKETT